MEFNKSRLLSRLFSGKTIQEHQKKRVIAVIPAYNEEEHIEKVVSEAKKYTTQVIVVDDASLDQTYIKARNAGAVVLKHAINLQKGAALKTGCDAAILLNADIIITLDGDGQHDPNEIPKFIKELKDYDIAIGVREFNNMPLKSKAGNIILSSLSKLLLKTKISDSQTGFRAFKSSIYPKIKWESNDYSVETEMIKNIRKYNLSCVEIPIKTIYKDNYKGSTAFDGIKITTNMVKWRFEK